MAHFAELDENNIVVQVLVVSNNDCGGGDFPESEPIGQEFLKSIGFTGRYVQTSYNSNFRKGYGGIGCFFDKENDVFILPKPYNSWILDENFDWKAPIPAPENGRWAWDETLGQWIEMTN